MYVVCVSAHRLLTYVSAECSRAYTQIHVIIHVRVRMEYRAAVAQTLSVEICKNDQKVNKLRDSMVKGPPSTKRSAFPPRVSRISRIHTREEIRDGLLLNLFLNPEIREKKRSV